MRRSRTWIAANAPDARWIALDDDHTLYEIVSQVLIFDPAVGISDIAVRTRLECWLAQ
jgi:hypothetical protein